MSVFQGDFLGFSFGEEHSYNLNISRVSTNDRYQDYLLPEFTDLIAQVPGGDGTYYWDTNYTKKQFVVSFAFDDLRDEDLTRMRRLFSTKGIKPLIFDEFPYKKYMVKCSQPPQLTYICFDQDEFRIFKGEGTVTFVAYYPFAFSVTTPSIGYSIDGVDINNVGDLPANIRIIYNLNNLNNIELKLKKEQDGVDIGQLNLANIVAAAGDSYMVIDTQTQLIEGYDSTMNKTGILYNRYIESGDFFWPPSGHSILYSSVPFEKVIYTPMYF